MFKETTERLQRLLEAPAPLTDQGKDELHRAFQEFFDAEEEETRRQHQHRRQELEAAAGPPAVAALAQGPNALAAGLTSPDAPTRRLALFLAHENHCDILTPATLSRLATSDPDLEVRRAAISHLSWLHEGTNDAAVGALLAALVSDARQDDRIRLDAYRGLIFLRGPKGHWYPGVARLRFPDDVDWALVSRYRPPAP